jgi:hypothetical protein
MEDRLNSKDFHHIASIKLVSRDETPEWYGILVAHVEMCGVFIYPWDSIMPGSIMGRYWSKKLLGETIHGIRRTMESHVHKLLLTNGLFSKDCDEEYRDILNTSSGNGYAYLHNILWSHHPGLTDKKVETKIPAITFGPSKITCSGNKPVDVSTPSTNPCSYYSIRYILHIIWI